VYRDCRVQRLDQPKLEGGMGSNVLEKALNMGGLNIIGIMLAAAFLLLLPLLAMQITHEVVWTPADFVLAWALLVGTGVAYRLATRKASNTAYRAAVGIAVVTSLILVWINLAVGFIGDGNNPANLMYGGVLGVGIIGAIIARFRPHGMARALFATAIAQMLVGVIALIAGLGFELLRNALILNCFFAALWVGSALLFRRSAREQN
jgi:uncharacterized membrane protein YdcZ (DUF606 family)